MTKISQLYSSASMFYYPNRKWESSKIWMNKIAKLSSQMESCTAFSLFLSPFNSDQTVVWRRTAGVRKNLIRLCKRHTVSLDRNNYEQIFSVFISINENKNCRHNNTQSQRCAIIIERKWDHDKAHYDKWCFRAHLNEIRFVDARIWIFNCSDE